MILLKVSLRWMPSKQKRGNNFVIKMSLYDIIKFQSMWHDISSMSCHKISSEKSININQQVNSTGTIIFENFSLAIQFNLARPIQYPSSTQASPKILLLQLVGIELVDSTKDASSKKAKNSLILLDGLGMLDLLINPVQLIIPQKGKIQFSFVL